MDFPALVKFLSQLKKNNNREWFQKNNDQYQALKKGFAVFVNDLILGMSEIEPELGDLTAKDCMFRINRDIRFSSDKSPYKTNFGTYLVQGGKKSPKAGYYLHIEPGASFLAGGLWMPPTEIITAVREEVDYNQEEFIGLTKSREFKKYFKSFEGEKLKTSPKGYSIEHPLIDILRHKSINMVYYLPPEQIEKLKVKDVLPVFKAMKPVNDFFNRCIEL